MSTNDGNLAAYHSGMRHERAWRSYAGMIEIGETTEDGKPITLERLKPLVPASIYAELENYFRLPASQRLDGDYE